MSTEAQTLTLTDFLRARYDEDEADARGAVGMHWDAREFRRVRTGNEDEPRWTTVVSGGGTDEHWEPPRPTEYGTTFTHIARHDPARVLAECEAKRQIIAEHAILRNPLDGLDYCRMCVGSAGFGETRKDALLGQLFPCLTLRLLAQPYCDHPDFREEWTR